MRILFLGPIHKQKDFLAQKENLPFLKFQAQQSYVEALTQLGNSVFVFRYTDNMLIPNSVKVNVEDFLEKLIPLWMARVQRLRDRLYNFSLENYLKNKKLQMFAEKVKPELIIFSGGTSTIFPKTLLQIKEKFHCPVVLLWGINPLTSSTLPERIMVKKGIIDLVVENDMGYATMWKALGAKRTVVLPISAIDPKIHKKIKLTEKEKKDYECDVCFVGMLTKERQKYLENLQEFSLKIWGDIPPGANLLKTLVPHYHGHAHGEKMVKIFNSAKIVLNFQPKDMTTGGNMRTFEICGCGAFQLADRVDSTWLKNNKEVVTFSSLTDLKAKITYYLAHENERKDIANAGYALVLNKHTYKRHFEKLLSIVQEGD